MNMRAIVSLRDVAREIEKQTERTAGYLNRRTGQMVTLEEDLISAVEDMEDTGEQPDPKRWAPRQVAVAKEVLESDDWRPLPGRFDIDEAAIAEQFAAIVIHEEALNEITEALRGRNPMERFREVVGRHGITGEWYNFRQEALEMVAREWLEENGIPFTTGPGAQR